MAVVQLSEWSLPTTLDPIFNSDISNVYFFFCPYVYPQLIQLQSYSRQRQLTLDSYYKQFFSHYHVALQGAYNDDYIL